MPTTRRNGNICPMPLPSGPPLPMALPALHKHLPRCKPPAVRSGHQAREMEVFHATARVGLETVKLGIKLAGPAQPAAGNLGSDLI